MFSSEGEITERTLLYFTVSGSQLLVHVHCWSQQRNCRLDRFRAALLKHNNSIYHNYYASDSIITNLSSGVPGVAVVSSDEWYSLDKFASRCNVSFVIYEWAKLSNSTDQIALLPAAYWKYEYRMDISKERHSFLSTISGRFQ